MFLFGLVHAMTKGPHEHINIQADCWKIFGGLWADIYIYE